MSWNNKDIRSKPPTEEFRQGYDNINWSQESGKPTISSPKPTESCRKDEKSCSEGGEPAEF